MTNGTESPISGGHLFFFIEVVVIFKSNMFIVLIIRINIKLGFKSYHYPLIYIYNARSLASKHKYSHLN